MEEKYLKERTQKYEDIFKENEPNLIEQKISLRKSKKNETLMSKRAKLLSEKKVPTYEPKINKNELSSKVLEIYDEERNIEQKNIELILTKYFSFLENHNQGNYNDSYFILDRLLFIISSMNDQTLYKTIDF